MHERMHDMSIGDCLAAGRAWRDGKLVDEDVTADELSAEASDDDLLVWVDLLRPTARDLTELAERLDLPFTSVEDALAPHERPKATRHGATLFFTTYFTHLEEGTLRLGRLSGFVLPTALVTIRLDDSVDLGPVTRRWEENPDLLRHGVGALLHGLLDVVVDGHFDTVQQLDDSVEALEDELFAERQTGREFAQRVYGFRKVLVDLRRVVLPMREVVNALLIHRSDQADHDNDLGQWYQDLYDHVLRVSEWTDSLRDMVTTVFETNLSLQDARLNTVMKKLAGWAAVIAVPTAITGWFGQNVPYPGFSSRLGLWLSVLLIVGGSGLLYVAFRRRDWL